MLNFLLLFDIVSLFQDYGIIISLLVLAVLISYIVIRNSTKRIQDQEKKIDELYKRIEGLLTKYHSDDNEELAGKFMNYAESANKIQIQIYHMLKIFDCERVSIYEFHNGGKNLAGIEFKKCSNTYEAVSLETKPIIREMQNLPISINPLWSRILATRQQIDIADIDKLEDNFLKVYLENQGIRTFHAMILEDYAHTPIGFITLEYYNYSKGLNQKQLDEFYDIAIKISTLITIK